jgi:cyclophilin family peptidyl-prolyl cis-trans isomerase
MKKILLIVLCGLIALSSLAQKEVKLKKKDKKRDVELITTQGAIVIRLSDSTPLHRDNFLKLAKSGFYDSTLFHRVISQFMIQGGDPKSKSAAPGEPLGNGDPGYTIPAEFRSSLFHKKGVIAAARTGDDINPKKESSGSQFYIVAGKTFTDDQLNTIEKRSGRSFSPKQREIYKTIGGTPHLDQGYTVFGEVIKGMEVVDKISVVETSKNMDRDRPLQDVKIIKARLIKRKK